MNILLILSIIAVISLVLWSLLSGRKEELATKKDEDEDSPEKIFRRRQSDREIEAAFPDDPAKQRRRNTDIKETDFALQDIEAAFKLPYLADEIISDNSMFRMYKRTLQNSEIYAIKGDFNTAISLYEGVYARIKDADTRDKIQADIDYLKSYREIAEKQKEEKAASASSLREQKTAREGLDPDKIADRVFSRLKDDIEELKAADIVSRLKNEGGEMSALKNEIDELKENIREISKSRLAEKVLDAIPEKHESMKPVRIPNLKPKHRAHDYSAGGRDNGDMDTGAIDELIRDEIIDSLKSKADNNRAGLDAEKIRAETEKIRSEIESLKARSELDAARSIAEKAMEGIQSKKSYEPPQEPVKGPPLEREKHVEKEKDVEEDPDDFDLLAEIDRDRDESTLTDEDIFARILRDDKKDTPSDDFAIIGKARQESDEYNILDSSYDKKRRDEESFYRNLIKTDRRKKKELPILKVSYDFGKLPDEFSLSREKNILEYSFYKYKPMLEKADEFIKKRKVRDALNYYKVVMGQNIPPEFKVMLKRNMNDLTEYLEKYLAAD